MHMPDRHEFDAILRLDFVAFVERVFSELKGSTAFLYNFHIAVICSDLMALQRGDFHRLAVALPPRSLKTIIVSVAYVAWLLGHDPSVNIICASYGQQLSDDPARACRQVLMSDWYKRLFPGTRLVSNRAALGDLVTTAGGRRFATSVGGTLTGFGADYIIVDDPTKPDLANSSVERIKANEWARNTMLTRLDDKANGKVVVVMQRLHQEDMIGYLSGLLEMKVRAFPAIAQRDEHYEIETPFGLIHHYRKEGEALHPERESLKVLNAIRYEIGEQNFAAQFLQMPAAPGGNIIKVDGFGQYDQTHMPKFDYIVQSWDTANKPTELADFSVCTTWGRIGKSFFLIHVWRKKVDFHDLQQAVRDQAQLWDACHVLIEDAGSGTHLLQSCKREGFYKAVPITPKGAKELRAYAITALIESGQVRVPMQASWLESYISELTMFPAGRYDDQVDSTTQALTWMSAYNGAEQWLQAMDEVDRRRNERNYGVQYPENYTVSFRHVEPNAEIKLSNGRWIFCAADGLYHVTPTEWQNAMLIPGVMPVHHSDH
jgi:predicted phage terminase large subunit-like protein